MTESKDDPINKHPPLVEWTCSVCGVACVEEPTLPANCINCGAPQRPFVYECIDCELGFRSNQYKRCPIVCPQCEQGSPTDEKNIVDADISNVHWRKKRQDLHPEPTDDVETSKQVLL
jgi:hypothetical protein